MKKNWRSILSVLEKPLEGFKRYKTDNDVDLPQHAEFTGDKFPSGTGDPAKEELKAFEKGNSFFKKDVKREKGAADHGSALMSEKVKYKDMDTQLKEKGVKPSYAGKKVAFENDTMYAPSGRSYFECPTCGFDGRLPSEGVADLQRSTADWMNSGNGNIKCPKCGTEVPIAEARLDSWKSSSKKTGWRQRLSDMSLKQKPDGTVQLDITSQPGQPLFNNTQTGQPGALSPDQTQQTTTPPAPVETAPAEQPVQSSKKLAEMALFEEWFSTHQDDPQLRQEYQDYFTQTNAEDMSMPLIFKEWMEFKFGETVAGMPISSSNTTKKWLIDKVGSYRLIGRECEKFASILITKDHKEVESARVEKSDHPWHEVIPQGVWQTKVHEYAS